MLDILKRISTKSGKIDSFNPATDEKMHELEHILREIQPDFNLREMIMKSKVELSDYKKIHKAIKDHCILGYYMFSFKKCSNTNCTNSSLFGDDLKERQKIVQAEAELAETLTGQKHKSKQTWKMHTQKYRPPADKPYNYPARTKYQPTQSNQVRRQKPQQGT